MDVTSEKLMVAGAVAGLLVFAIALLTNASVVAIYLIGVVAVGLVMFGAAALVAYSKREPRARSRRGRVLARHN